VDRSLQGLRRRNTVGPSAPTIEEIHESGTGRGALMKVKPWGLSSNSWAEVVLGEIQVSVRAMISMLWVLAVSNSSIVKRISVPNSAHAGRCPVYITDCVRAGADKASRSGLRSAKSSSLSAQLKRNSEKGHSRSLVRLPGTLFRLDHIKLSIRLLFGIIWKLTFLN